MMMVGRSTTEAGRWLAHARCSRALTSVPVCGPRKMVAFAKTEATTKRVHEADHTSSPLHDGARDAVSGVTRQSACLTRSGAIAE